MKCRSFRFRTSPPSAARRFLLGQDGGAAAEYALLLAIVAVAATVAVFRLSGAVSGSIGANATAVAMADTSDEPRSARPLTSAGATGVRSLPSIGPSPAPAEVDADRSRRNKDEVG